MTNESQCAGDSVQEIIIRYSDMVYRLAYARTGSSADADDVYQEVFLRYFRTRPQIGSEEHLKAWLIRTTIHTSLNLLRSAWRRYAQAMPEHFDAAATHSPTDARSEALHHALRRLPEKQRIVIHLYYYEEYSTEEIADLIGQKPSTVRSHLKRGREKIKLLMRETEGK